MYVLIHRYVVQYIIILKRGYLMPKERNYPKSYINFWKNLTTNGKATRTVSGNTYSFRLVNNYVEMTFGTDKVTFGYIGNCPCDMEHLYCDLLDWYLFPRVPEYTGK